MAMGGRKRGNVILAGICHRDTDTVLFRQPSGRYLLVQFSGAGKLPSAVQAELLVPLWHLLIPYYRMLAMLICTRTPYNQQQADGSIKQTVRSRILQFYFHTEFQ